MRRGQVMWDTLVPWLVGLMVLVLMGAIYLLVSERGKTALTMIKGLVGLG